MKISEMGVGTKNSFKPVCTYMAGFVCVICVEVGSGGRLDVLTAEIH